MTLVKTGDSGRFFYVEKLINNKVYDIRWLNRRISRNFDFVEFLDIYNDVLCNLKINALSQICFNNFDFAVYRGNDFINIYPVLKKNKLKDGIQKINLCDFTYENYKDIFHIAGLDVDNLFFSHLQSFNSCDDIFINLDENKITGYIAGSTINEDLYELKLFYVKTPKLGLGKLLFNKLIKSLDNNLKEVLIISDSDSDYCVYEKLGCKFIKSIDKVFMKK